MAHGIVLKQRGKVGIGVTLLGRGASQEVKAAASAMGFGTEEASQDIIVNREGGWQDCWVDLPSNGEE